MTLRIVFHPKVFSEVDTIMAYYEKVSGSTLAVDSYDEFLLFVGKAAQQPEIYGLQTGSYVESTCTVSPTIFCFA